MKVLITAGGTEEPIDNVRKIINSSSGALGSMIADKLLSMGYEVEFIHSYKSTRPSPNKKLKETMVRTALDAERAIERALISEHNSWVIHTMAVADYRVSYTATPTVIVSEILMAIGATPKDSLEETILGIISDPKEKLTGNKLSSRSDEIVVGMTKNSKIINSIKKISPTTHLIGFKLLDGGTAAEFEQAVKKQFSDANTDFILSNDLSDIREGNHIAHIWSKDMKSYPLLGKEDIVRKIAELVGESNEK